MTETHQSSDSQLSSSPTNVRHFMWNDDYIELLSLRLELAQVRNLVEIGSGLGDLAGLFGLYMKAGSTVHGFDDDPAIVAEARALAGGRDYSVTFKFDEAPTDALPLPDASADLVISHRGLKGVADPAAAVAEMCRVVRPGGRIVAFEPNTLAQALVSDSDGGSRSIDERVTLVRYQLYYEAGKKALGHGDDSVGDTLPALFADAGLDEIEVRLSDKAGSLVPPYDTDEERARIKELLGWRAEFEANIAFIRTCFLAGGGTQPEWEAYATYERTQADRIAAGIAAETYTHPGGLLTYIVIGMKPES